MTLHEKHMHRIELVNRSTTEAEHTIRERELSSWRCGVEDAGVKLTDLCACDNYYLHRGINRPMAWGVWLDWTEAPQAKIPHDTVQRILAKLRKHGVPVGLQRGNHFLWHCPSCGEWETTYRTEATWWERFWKGWGSFGAMECPRCNHRYEI